MNSLSKKGVSLLQISIILTSIFAFAFMISLTVSVNAADLSLGDLKENIGKKVTQGGKEWEIVEKDYLGVKEIGLKDAAGDIKILTRGGSKTLAEGASLSGLSLAVAGEVVKGTLSLAPPLSFLFPKGVAATVPGHLLQGLSWAMTVVGVIQIEG